MISIYCVTTVSAALRAARRARDDFSESSRVLDATHGFRRAATHHRFRFCHFVNGRHLLKEKPLYSRALGLAIAVDGDSRA